MIKNKLASRLNLWNCVYNVLTVEFWYFCFGNGRMVTKWTSFCVYLKHLAMKIVSIWKLELGLAMNTNSGLFLNFYDWFGVKKVFGVFQILENASWILWPNAPLANGLSQETTYWSGGYNLSCRSRWCHSY